MTTASGPCSLSGPAARSAHPIRRWALLLSAWLPAAVLVLAGVAKMDNPFQTALFLNSIFELPVSSGIFLARGLGAVEAAIGLALAARARSLLPAVLALAMFSSFAGLLGRLLLSKGGAVNCGCFGDLWGGIASRHQRYQLYFDIGVVALLFAHILLIHDKGTPRQTVDAPAT